MLRPSMHIFLASLRFRSVLKPLSSVIILWSEIPEDPRYFESVKRWSICNPDFVDYRKIKSTVAEVK